MVDRIIVNYISSNKRLVVPGLGAFLKKEPTEIIFIDLLKSDDGVLTELYAQQMGIRKSDASVAIGRYVDGVVSAINATGEYTIKGLGRLVVNDSGSYDLLMEQVNGATVQPKVERKIEQQQIAPVDRVEVKAPEAPKVQEVHQYRPTVQPTVQPAVKTTVSAPAKSESKRVDMPYLKSQKKPDVILIVAIAMAVIAVLALIYGLFANTYEVNNLIDDNHSVVLEHVETAKNIK